MNDSNPKTLSLKLDVEHYDLKDFDGCGWRAILRAMSDTTEPGLDEPSLDEQIAAYQREYRDLDPQVEQVVSALGRLNRRMNVAYGRQLAALGISNAEWEVLKTLVLGGEPYRLGPGELAKRLGLTPAAMTHRIDRMAGEGLVTRDRDENNRVRVIVELTDEGRTKWLEAMRMATDFEADLLQDLGSGERGVLGEMLTRLLRRVEHAQPDAGGRLTDLD
ncbi:DNA-binding transcriptional regulator, MarR family [Streptomyces sp. 2131.1]|nr:DNA-binding transcriptional regulator, MarR family [Streptomyces sp. 2131.1]